MTQLVAAIGWILGLVITVLVLIGTAALIGLGFHLGWDLVR